ncbi:hypothetical protein SO802_019041 [Lithocarpus litseifolius]|uniref:Transmembrane protein n=1 Tax=Lithocarpus litseifolius TaxID=425828 RepID=A0AAW2CPP1_9ROSI
MEPTFWMVVGMCINIKVTCDSNGGCHGGGVVASGDEVVGLGGDEVVILVACFSFLLVGGDEVVGLGFVILVVGNCGGCGCDCDLLGLRRKWWVSLEEEKDTDKNKEKEI